MDVYIRQPRTSAYRDRARAVDRVKCRGLHSVPNPTGPRRQIAAQRHTEKSKTSHACSHESVQRYMTYQRERGEEEAVGLEDGVDGIDHVS